jgi:hypothetical protein
VARRRGRRPLHPLELADAGLGDEVVLSDRLVPPARDEFFVRRHQEQVRGALHHAARDMNGVLRVPGGGDRARGARSVHDRGVELHPSAHGQRGTVARVEQVVVLELFHRRAHGVQGCAAAFEHRAAGAIGDGEPLLERCLRLMPELLDVPAGATVQSQGEAVPGRDAPQLRGPGRGDGFFVHGHSDRS